MKRTLYYNILPLIEHKNAIVICGMRQVGKTWLMRMLYDEVKEKKLWFDLDNPLDQLLFESIDYNNIYKELVKQSSLESNERLYVFIDEIQNYPDITKIIKYLIEYYSVKFVVSGSSNYYLRNLFPESLSGRKFLYNLNPLSFKEFLYFKNVLNEEALQGDNKMPLYLDVSQFEFEKRKAYYDEYLEFGGFPEVVLTEDVSIKTLVLKNIMTSFFEMDIKVFSELKDVRELRDLLLLLVPRNGNILDVSKLASELGINRVKMYAYIEFLQGVFFLKLIPKYSKSIDRSIAGGKKVYFSDTGLLNLLGKVTDGQLLETAVCNQLSNYGELSFYNQRNTSEIDFILNKNISFEVKTKAIPQDIEKLSKLSLSLGIEESYVISKKHREMGNIIYPQFF